MKQITLAQIAALLGCPAPQANPVISGVATLTEAGPAEISFLSSEKYARQFDQSRAAAVVVDRKIKRHLEEGRIVVLQVDDAELATAKVLELFASPIPRPPAGIDPAARVAPDAQIGAGAAIGPFAYIGSRTRIGAGTIIHCGVYVGDDVQIGENCEFFPHVVIRERITIGNRVIIHANSALGTDGFGYRWDGSQHAKIPHIGTVDVDDDVEIGSCVCVDRAKFAATRIGRGTKLDNLVQVAHNVVLGPHCIIAGQAGMAGSAHLGAGVMLGGQAAVRDHVSMGDRSIGAACTAVAEDVEPRAIVSGTPAIPHRQTLREQAALRRLPDLVVQVRKLQEKIDQMGK